MKNPGLLREIRQKSEITPPPSLLPWSNLCSKILSKNRWGSHKLNMLTKYIQAAMKQAKYEIFPDDGTFYGEIPICEGVYANAVTLEACREELQEVLEDWILLSLTLNLPLPVLDNIDLKITKEVA